MQAGAAFYVDRFARRQMARGVSGSPQAKHDAEFAELHDAAGPCEVEDARSEPARRRERPVDALRGRATVRARRSKCSTSTRAARSRQSRGRAACRCRKGSRRTASRRSPTAALVATVLLMPGKTFARLGRAQADRRGVRVVAGQERLRAHPGQRAAGQQRHRDLGRRQRDLRRVVGVSDDRRVLARESHEAAAHDAAAAVHARQRAHGRRRQAAHGRHEERRAGVRRRAGTAARSLEARELPARLLRDGDRSRDDEGQRGRARSRESGVQQRDDGARVRQAVLDRHVLGRPRRSRQRCADARRRRPHGAAPRRAGSARSFDRRLQRLAGAKFNREQTCTKPARRMLSSDGFFSPAILSPVSVASTVQPSSAANAIRAASSALCAPRLRWSASVAPTPSQAAVPAMNAAPVAATPVSDSATTKSPGRPTSVANHGASAPVCHMRSTPSARPRRRRAPRRGGPKGARAGVEGCGPRKNFAQVRRGGGAKRAPQASREALRSCHRVQVQPIVRDTRGGELRDDLSRADSLAGS